jgi:hypothetical protein
MTKSSAVSLYRRLLKAHKQCLPDEMRRLGDTYVKTEFRLHRNVTSPKIIATFISQWTEYLSHIEMQNGMQQISHLLNDDFIENTAMSSNISEVRPLVEYDFSTRDDKFRFGSDLPHDVPLSDDQRHQLEKLRLEAIRMRDKNKQQ